jgi:pseudaminic acid biosynthesis-associated methylase
MEVWGGPFGAEYTKRNSVSIDEYDANHERDFGVKRSQLNAEFLGALPRDARILEIGTNLGNQLGLLARLGFNNLYGVELQWGAIDLARQRVPRTNIVQGSAFEVPFRDAWFDVVFTSNVLIHFSFPDVRKVIAEMFRCSSKYLWGSEYWAAQPTEVAYRGHQELLWKTDYAKLFLSTFPERLELERERRLQNRTEDTIDNMYLLTKT